MQRIKISTDSTADIPQNFCEDLNISVLPLTVIADGKEYLDGVDILPCDFYKLLESSKKIPVSSQVTTERYLDLFEKTWKDGYTDLIHTSVNSKGSGTYQAGMIARNMFFEEHPDAASKLQIHLIDSKTYSMAYGIPVVEAAQLVQTGASVETILTHIQEWLEHTRPVFIPLDLKCVKKSGRISPAAAFVGDAIGLKPMITFEAGEAKIIDKIRGGAKGHLSPGRAV